TKLSNDLQRLVCFDAMAAAQPLASAAPATATPPTVGNWQIIQETNPMDDSQTVILVLPETGAGDSLGRKAEFYVRCTSGALEAFISWQDYLASDGGYDTKAKDVTLRWDSGPPTTSRLATSTDSTATFLSSPTSFYAILLHHKKLVAQVVPYNAGPRTAVFDLLGLQEISEPLRIACGIKQ
ncbi:MAG: hypothetical protein ABIR04_05180, partial [Cypionkella sp.]